MDEIKIMRDKVVGLLRSHEGTLRIVTDTADKFEVTGTIPTMQGKKKVDGMYFATVIPKPKDVRFYFFPVYTHKEQLGELPENLAKSLKGKSCFHIKKMDAAYEAALKTLIEDAIEIYRQDGLLTPPERQ